MRVNAIFIGIENKGIISKEVDLYSAKRSIEDIKQMTIKQQAEAVAEILRDINKSTKKEVITEEKAKELKKWTIEQFKNFNIYKIKETLKESAEVEIIEITADEKEYEIKYLEMI